MRRPRLVLHAGLGKTGSSAIQKYLRTEATALEREGLCYLGMELERSAPSPLDFGEDARIADLLAFPPDDPRALQRRLVSLITDKMAARPETQTFVWSQVALGPAFEVMGPVVRRLAKICDVDVVLYFRHQADWLASAYAQWGVKHKTYPGPIRSFDEFRPLAVRWGAEYRAVIEGWRAIRAATVHVRSYDLADDMVADFAAVTGIAPVAADRTAHQHYATPDTAVLSLFKLHQGQSDAPALPGALLSLLARHGVAERRYRPVDPADTTPSGPEWDALVASFAAENAALERDFGLTLVPPAPRVAPGEPHAAPATLIPPLLDLLIAMDARIVALERRLKAKGG